MVKLLTNIHNIDKALCYMDFKIRLLEINFRAVELEREKLDLQRFRPVLCQHKSNYFKLFQTFSN